MANFLQTASWARFQQELGFPVFQHEGAGYSYLAILQRNATGPYLYCPYGPEAAGIPELNAAIDSLQQLANEQGARFIRIEPVSAGPASSLEKVTAALRRAGCRPAPRDIQPSRSWLVDLTEPEDDLLRGMKSTNRNLHRNIHKKGVTFSSSNDPADVDILLRFLHQVAEQSQFKPQDDAYLRAAARTLMPDGHAAIYIAELDEEPIGAAMVYDSDDTRTYAHAALDSRHRKLSAGIPMVVRMILDAKAKGLKTFDMWGIAPDDQPDHPWAGFSYFKKSFGGAPVQHPGTWDLPVNKPVYAAYTFARRSYQYARQLNQQVGQQVGQLREKVAAGRRA